MNLDAWMTLAVIAAVVVLLASERISPPYAILGGVSILLVAGVVDAGQAFAGFSNPAPITVAALFVLAGAVERTGALDALTSRALGRNGSERGQLLRVLVPVAGASAFLNNTPIVAMVAPRVAAWARQASRSPSRYLMPISFAAMVGGVGTLIGTSTNIVISGLMVAEGMEPIGFFEISRVGAPVALACLVAMIALAPVLLPDRRASGDDAADAREYTIEMMVAPGSALVGTPVGAAGLRNLQGVFLVEIERDGRLISPVSPEEVLQPDDRLVFVGDVNRVVDLQRVPGLSSAQERHFRLTGTGAERRFYEAVLSPGSELTGRTLKQAGFRAAYGAAVVAIHRAGERVREKLGEVPMRPGDVLLVLATPGFYRRWREHRDFLIVSPLDGKVPVHRDKAWVVYLAIAAILLLAGTGLVDILRLALIVAVGLVALGALTPGEARDSVDLNVIVVLAGSFGLGAAMAQSGLAAVIAQGLVGTFAGLGDIGILLGVILATLLLTELITNNAAAVLMFPIAFATAAQTGLQPRPLAIAVAVAASASFLTPIGYQTNTMVYGMGGYHFTDFARFGFPLNLIVLAACMLIVPAAWPLR